MADYNPITIEQFPELTSLLSSDKIILFTEENEKLIPLMVDLSAFGEYALSAGALAELSEKVSQLESRYKDIEREFKNTYVTPTQIAAEYSTLDNFNSQINKIEKTEVFKTSLSKKADDVYLEYKTNVVKNQTQALKQMLGSSRWEANNGKDKLTAYGYKILMAAQAKPLTESEED